MARKKLLHIRSNVVENGEAKLPTYDQIDYGEIAINFADGYETISIKNSNDEIIKFSSDEYFEDIISEDEKVTAAALNDLEENKADKSEIPSVSDYFDGADYNSSGKTIDFYNGNTLKDSVNVNDFTFIDDITISGTSVVENRIADIPFATSSGYGVVIMDNELNSASTNAVVNSAITKAIFDNEKVTAAALNSLSENKADKDDLDDLAEVVSGKVDNVMISGVSIVTNNVANIPIASTNAYGLVIVDNALNSASTNPLSNAVITKTIYDDEKVIAASLNELEERKANVTDIPDVSIYFDDVQYNSSGKTIEFYNNDVLRGYIDATAFIKDGMVNSVAVEDVTSGGTTVKCIVITFNTDAGKEDINIPITDIFDSNLYYTKTESDTKYGKVDDVVFSGTSIVTNKIAALSAATSSMYGLVKVDIELDKTSPNPIANSAVSTVISEDERITAAALNSLNNTKASKDELSSLESVVSEKVSGVTISGISIVTDNVADIPIATSSGYGLVIVDDEFDSGSTNPIQNKVIDVTLTEMGRVTSAALNLLNDTKADKEDLSDLESEISSKVSGVTISGVSIVTNNVADIPIADANGYGLVIVDDTFSTTSNNPIKNATISNFIERKELVIASALNDLSEKIDTHSGDTTIHVTSNDKSSWNTHVSDTTIHVTSSDKATWNAKQDALTFDTTPTQNSTNPVTSGGIYNVIGDIETLLGGI